MPDPRGHFSLEDLLRAKREERPDDAFWTRFDRELKAKQRRLLQRQIVNHEHLRSPFAKRVNRFLLASGSIGFAALVAVVAVRMGPQDGPSGYAGGAKPSAPTPAAPSFTVNQPAAPGGTHAANPGLAEFSALGQTARPRIVVEALNPNIAKGPAATVARAEASTRPERQAVSALPERESIVTASLGQFDRSNLSGAMDENADEDFSRFESVYYLGKYADPLGGDFTANFEAGQGPSGTFGRAESRSISELDTVLSSQGSRADKTLDTLTLRF